MARFDLVPPFPIRKLAEHLGRGATKYGDRNWERGYQWSLSYAALQRHLNAFWDGEDYDPEFPESHHLDAAMFHVVALRDFSQKFPEYDDRPGTIEDDRTHDEILIDAVYEARRTPSFNPSPNIGPAFNEQSENDGRQRTVQASRWQVP